MAHLVSILLGGALAAASHWVLTTRFGLDPTAEPELFWGVVCAPIVLALVVATVTSSFARPSRVVAAGAEAVEEPLEHGALRLLGLLQEEGRLVDFLKETIVTYSDEQVGAATRDIHDGCARALAQAIELEPVLGGEEDTEVTIEAGFDPAAIRLTGNVAGEPPFTGILRHPGWRVKAVVLPARSGIDPLVVAPAEVEIT